MKITILTKANRYIKFDSDDANTWRTSSEIFAFMENIWNDWFDEEGEHNREIEDMYFSDEAIYTKKGAILQGIEQLVQVAEELNKTFFTQAEMHTCVDISCAFN
jgi:hypothetical protein